MQAIRESPCPDQLVSLNLLLSLIVGRDHQVIIWIHVLKGWRFALDGGRFAVHTGDLQHPAGVVFQQIPRERFPSSSHADHDVFVVQHLKGKESKRVQFRAFLQSLESTFRSQCCHCVLSALFFMPGGLSAGAAQRLTERTIYPRSSCLPRERIPGPRPRTQPRPAL